jgi:hypothetical protein
MMNDVTCRRREIGEPPVENATPVKSKNGAITSVNVDYVN